MRLRSIGMVVVLLLCCACEKIPRDRYGVSRVVVEGNTQMSAKALRACLATRERAHAGLTLGVEEVGACGEPPFPDHDPARLRLWAWPWTDWPLLDSAALERDRDRIERWYQARGFHDARVHDIRVQPAQARIDDTLDPSQDDPPCARRKGSQGCEAQVTLVVEEGEPTVIVEIAFENLDRLPRKLQRRLRKAVTLKVGGRADEAFYEQSKLRMTDMLGTEGYALAKVRGVLRIDRPNHQAWASFAIETGPVCTFGDVVVEGAEYLPTEPIRAATLIKKGARYSQDDLVDAQRAVLALGSLAAVEVEPILPTSGTVVDVRVRVSPVRRSSFALGVGIQAGEIQTSQEQVSVPLWDVHLLGRYRRHNLFGGFNQLTIEERPRFILLDSFPATTQPRFGNDVDVELRKPGFLEARTTLFTSISHAFGPDPYDAFFRHRIDSRVGVERTFLGGKLLTRISLENSVYHVPSRERGGTGLQPAANSVLTFPEQLIRLDLRDDRRRPHGGGLFEFKVHEAGFWLPSKWDYFRVLADARGYIPLPARITIATRFALGMLFVKDASSSLDAFSQQLGPRDFRLRGGGASSNRGFLPGSLGDGTEGGTRRWEASLELRAPLIDKFGVVGFWDMGDVSRAERFRFDHPQAAAGFGLRYFSLIGAIRLDFAWKIRSLQVLAATDQRTVDLKPDGTPRSRGGDFVFHFTIGEAF